LPPDFNRDVYCLFGLPFDAVSLTETEQRIRSAIEQRTPCFLSTPNLNFLIACQTDAAFRNSVINSDLSVADGMPIVWLSRLLGIPIRERVAGSTLFERLRQGSGKKIAVYLFGGPNGVAETACKQLNSENKGMSCVGFESPGFGSIDDMSSDGIIERINSSNADFLVVALGARKGQAWIEYNRHRLNVPVISHLGAVVNFVAGTVRRAPTWMQNIGCEWLWRIKEEPTIWKRYALDGIYLIILIATNVMPYKLFLWHQKLRSQNPTLGVVTTETSKNTYVLRLSGYWTKENISIIRNHLRLATVAKKDLLVDMKGVVFIDSAFIGLLMLTKATQTKHQKKLEVIQTQKKVRKIFKFCCAGDLLNDRE
jgi:N-acetylglucosaminyldiphosphoundecaprenol N-acetyl-beta-D-mannosaminyltransferase